MGTTGTITPTRLGRLARALTPARLRAGALLVALWTLFGLLSSAHFFFGKAAVDARASFGDLADHVLVFYWGWALLTPAVLAVARRAARRSVRDWRAWALVAGAAAAALVAHGVLYLGVIRLVGVEPDVRVSVAELRDYAMRHGGGDLATFAVLVGVYLLVDANRRARERALAAAALEARLARADLELLRWQLQPHFLFNALNTVSTLVLKGETQDADRAIGLIARYLRAALSQRADATVPLADELAAVRQYVEIEALRFGGALRVETRVADAARDARVPSLIVQPLVENAIRHGLANAPGVVRVEATVEGGRLRVSVADPGGGVGGVAGERDGDGFGLRYVRERLRHFYGAAARFGLARDPDGTTVAIVDLPLLLPSPPAARATPAAAAPFAATADGAAARAAGAPA